LVIFAKTWDLIPTLLDNLRNCGINTQKPKYGDQAGEQESGLMADEIKLIRGEYVTKMGDRFRLTLPKELTGAIVTQSETACVLARERFGALSLWNRETWQDRVESGIEIVETKVRGHRLPTQIAEVQQFSRLLSTRSREVTVAERGRLVIPEAFRDFLRVKVGEDCVVVGAGLCIEIWHPETWQEYLKQEIGSFGELFEKLST